MTKARFLIVLVAVLLAQPAFAAPPDGLRGMLWAEEYREISPGYCDYADGGGWDGALSWPVPGRIIKAGRGFRDRHEGIDILADEGTPVTAAAPGVVIWAGESAFGGGQIIMLAHGNGWRTYYGHLSAVGVTCGQWVARGEQLGASGDTGATFAHLHFGVMRYADAYDPGDWLAGAEQERDNGNGETEDRLSRGSGWQPDGHWRIRRPVR